VVRKPVGGGAVTATFLAGTGHESSVAWPTHASGDLGYLFVEHGGGTVATPTGCAIVAGFPVNQGGGSILSAFVIEATSGAMPNLALSGGSNHMWGVIVAVSDTNNDNPIAAYAAMKQSGATVNGTAPGVLVDEHDLAVLVVMAYGGDNAGPMSASEANASLSSVAEVYDAGTTTGDGGGIIIISGVKASPGVIDPTTSTLTSTVFVSATLAFRPAPVFTVAGTVTIDGVAAADSTPVEIWDDTIGKIAATTTVAGGSGGFTALVPYNDADRYRVVVDDGTNYGASALDTAV
jgi:hypothetical protein